jgi:hypothetical protein
MIDHIDPRHGAGQLARVAEVVRHELRLQVAEMVDPRGSPHEAANLITAADKCLGKMTADESTRPGHKYGCHGPKSRG